MVRRVTTMRKSVVGSAAQGKADSTSEWMDVEQLAQVEVSSEDAEFPVENALVGRVTTGWKASATGPQVIRLLFDEAIALRRLQLHFVERTAARSQEFAVYAGASADSLREVVRQQFTFSPGGSTEEVEEYSVQADGVKVLEVRIDPDRAHDPRASVNYASLMALRVA